jgi:TonB family protein
MNIRTFAQLAVALAAIAAVSPAVAQNYDIVIENMPNVLTPINQTRARYPNSGIRSGQEGWVRVNFVVTPEGNAIDPIVVDSVGGTEFHASVQEAVSEWTFQPPGEILANNTVDVRIEIHDGRDLATSNFMRRYRRIVQHLYNEENLEARTSVDQARDIGGWNLYESTMLWLMIGRVEGVEGNSTGKLEAYRRALGVSNSRSLKGDDRRELLRKMFELEMELSQYASAQSTLRLLRREPGSKSDLDSVAELIARLDNRMAGDTPIAARATLYSPGDVTGAQSIWTYIPARQSFSFDALDGNVERFEVRCERNRLEGPVEAGKSWSLPEDAKNCRVIVFGDDGANFQFVEHNETDTPDATADAAVARSDVLD